MVFTLSLYKIKYIKTHKRSPPTYYNEFMGYAIFMFGIKFIDFAELENVYTISTVAV